MQISKSFRIVATLLLFVAGVVCRVHAAAPASAPATTTASGDETFAGVLARYAAAVEMPDSISFDATTTYSEKMLHFAVTDPIFLENSTTHTVMYKDGRDRLDIEMSQKMIFSQLWKGEIVPDKQARTYSSHNVILKDRWAAYVISGTTKYVSISTEPHDYVIVSAMSALRSGKSVEGVLTDVGYNVASLSREKNQKQNVTSVEADGRNLYLLTSDVKLTSGGKDGSISMWVDREDYLPYKIVFNAKSSTDKQPTTAIATYTYQSAVIDGRKMITGFSLKKLTTLKSGSIKETIVTHARTNVRLNPAFPPTAFQFNIPDGTPVSERSTPFSKPNPKAPKKEWRNGQVVPVKVLPPVDPNQL